MKQAFLDKLIARLDRIDPGRLQTHFLRLAQEKGLMETIFHAIHEGIIVLDREGRITYANRAAGTLLGFSEAEAVGQPVRRYLRHIDWERVVDLNPEEWARLMSSEIEINYPKKRFLNFYVVPLSAVNAEEDGAVLLLRDITRDRADQATVLESERLSAVTLLAAGVAHEIGNPLNSLTIHLQLMDRELKALPAEQRESLDELLSVARQEVARLDQVITQFLKAVRPAPPQLESASVEEVLRETLDFLKHEIRDRVIDVDLSVQDDIPKCPIDRNQVKQAFFNIVRNAIQAMPNGGQLTIGVRSNDQFVGVAFADSGPGIAADDIAHLFEPYHTTRQEGTGLGLMVVQRIVRDHGGEIDVQSVPGAGTTFTVLLPHEQRRFRLLKAPDAAEELEEKTLS
jgi:PAS domain S-box-containing protein